MNLWIVPGANAVATLNVGFSLANPIRPEVRQQFEIGDLDRAWGKMPGGDGIDLPNQMFAGDVCLFYTRTAAGLPAFYQWAGIVDRVIDDPDLATAIWNDGAFRHVYLLRQVWPISLTTQQFAQWTTYQAAPPMGMRKANPEFLNRILQEHGTVEKWARSLSTANPQPPKPHSIATIPTVNKNPRSIDPIIDALRRSGFHFSDSAIRNFYASIRAKPFVILAGNSGTGKSRLVRLFAEACGATAANGGFHLVAVRPDWSDGGELLGYLDLQNTFRPGQLLEPLLRAHALPQQPVFVCLDEMNLARVEHYFSDFLSKIESRRRAADRSVVSDAVISARDLELLAPASIPESLRNTLARLKSAQQGVCLPPNLIVVGTVNMDETTHAFSRKVLDRANTLEIDAGQLGADLPSPTPVVPPTPSLGAIDLTAPFLTAQDMVQDPKHTEALAHVAGLLDSLNDILSEANLQVAYRTRDEAAAFFIHATAVGLSSDEADHAIVMQKILPRVQGSSPRLARILRELLNRFQPGGLIDSNSEKLKEELLVLRKDTSRSPLVRKIASMWLIYEEEGFTSFWVA